MSIKIDLAPGINESAGASRFMNRPNSGLCSSAESSVDRMIRTIKRGSRLS